MKKFTIYLCCLALGFSIANVARATSVGFDLAGTTGETSHSLSGISNMASALDVNMGTQVFYLCDGQTQTNDLFGGALKWDPKTLSDVFTTAGNSLTAEYQNGSANAGINAWRTPQRFPILPWPAFPPPKPDQGSVPLPEPGKILFLGLGFIGLALYDRRRMRG